MIFSRLFFYTATTTLLLATAPQMLAFTSPASSILQTPAKVQSVGQDLVDFYSQKSNYYKVYDDVMNWYGTTTNGCVAFMSTALRMIGVGVPKYDVLNGERVSLVTRAFSTYLHSTLGWEMVTDSADLLPGDVVFSQDDPNASGYPAHTLLFQNWSSRSAGIANVIDNQGFTHQRNMWGDNSLDFTPFAYALRPAGE